MSAPYLRQYLLDMIDVARSNDEHMLSLDDLLKVLSFCADTPPDAVCVYGNTQGLVIMSEGRAYAIRDSDPIQNHMAPVERAVHIARLRAVADELEATVTQ